jgi:hypothetical protein
MTAQIIPFPRRLPPSVIITREEAAWLVVAHTRLAPWRSLQRPARRALARPKSRSSNPRGAIMTITAQRENSGVLFKNERKHRENSPDYQGSLNVAGTEYQLSAWIKQGPKAKFMSHQAQE